VRGGSQAGRKHAPAAAAAACWPTAVGCLRLQGRGPLHRHPQRVGGQLEQGQHTGWVVGAAILAWGGGGGIGGWVGGWGARQGTKEEGRM
jgi:hypothetical protein